MAHRQLCAAAFVVLGLVAAGCGGNSSSGAGETPMTNDSAPPSADDVPGNADDTPGSVEDTPASADDAPPSSEDTPAGAGGGRLQQICEDACDVLEALGECGDDEIDPMAEAICANDGCAVAIDPGAPIPCLDAIEALFECIASLPNVCMPTDQQTEQCRGVAESFGECAEEAGPDNEPEPGETCTMAMGCDCPTLCDSCMCAGGDTEDCAQVCSTDQ